MGTVIAFNGKGGTGKTTVASLFVRWLRESGERSVLAVDADPNSNLPESLGSGEVTTIVDIVDDVSKSLGSLPAGVSKDRLIETRVQEAIAEQDGFDLLVMGRPEGPGCYCYVNNLLRDIMARIAEGYRYVIIDNAAGMEHISRRTMRSLHKLVLVSDHTLFGIKSARSIYDLVQSMGIVFKEAFLVANKCGIRSVSVDREMAIDGVTLAGHLSTFTALAHASENGMDIFSLKDDKVMSEFDGIARMIKDR